MATPTKTIRLRPERRDSTRPDVMPGIALGSMGTMNASPPAVPIACAPPPDIEATSARWIPAGPAGTARRELSGEEDGEMATGGGTLVYVR
jgi:hypothetical protein